jgi:hypothetical protein
VVSSSAEGTDRPPAVTGRTMLRRVARGNSFKTHFLQDTVLNVTH